jgi:hypothetical protein
VEIFGWRGEVFQNFGDQRSPKKIAKLFLNPCVHKYDQTEVNLIVGFIILQNAKKYEYPGSTRKPPFISATSDEGRR